MIPKCYRQLVLVWAVGNADPELKLVADFTSNTQYGAGAVESINYLIDHSLI